MTHRVKKSNTNNDLRSDFIERRLLIELRALSKEIRKLEEELEHKRRRYDQILNIPDIEERDESTEQVLGKPIRVYDKKTERNLDVSTEQILQEVIRAYDRETDNNLYKHMLQRRKKLAKHQKDTHPPTCKKSNILSTVDATKEEGIKGRNSDADTDTDSSSDTGTDSSSDSGNDSDATSDSSEEIEIDLVRQT